jgi:hypothetical protein
VNTSERGAPPSRPPTGPAGPKGPRRLEPVRDDRVASPPAGNAPPAHDAPPGRDVKPGRNVTPVRGDRAVLGGAAPTSRGPRRLAPPKAVRVRADTAGRPEAIGGRAVEAVRESWLVEDRWWTDAPLRRRYWEIVTADGRDLVVFRDLEAGRWFSQR